MDPSVIGVTLVVINLIGGAGLVGWLRTWIKALQGNVDALRQTVAAHEASLKSIGSVNSALLDVFKTLDPQRWAAEVDVHKRLADERAAALIERAERNFQEQRAQHGQLTKQMVGDAIVSLVPYSSIAIRFLPYVPKEERLRIINNSKLGDEFKAEMLKWAEETPYIQPGSLREAIMGVGGLGGHISGVLPRSGAGGFHEPIP